MSDKKAPDMSGYLSDRVFDGIRVLSDEQRRRHLDRIQRLRAKRDMDKKTS